MPVFAVDDDSPCLDCAVYKGKAAYIPDLKLQCYNCRHKDKYKDKRQVQGVSLLFPPGLSNKPNTTKDSESLRE